MMATPLIVSLRHTSGLKALFTLAALLLALSAGHPVAAQGETLDLATYERLLREGQTAAARGDRISLDLVAPRLVEVRAISLPGGGSVPVDNTWLADELTRPTARLDLIATRLGALVDALTAPQASAPADAETQLETILSRPPFADPSDEQREPSWIDRFFEWLADRLDELAQPVGEAASGTPGTAASWVITALGAALVLGVLVFWLRGLGRTLRPTVLLAPPAALEARDEADARSKAATLARAGNYREAVRLLALSALLWLDEAGRLRYDAHQTNREHLARLREQPDLRRRLTPVVDTADRVWYGGAPLDSAGYAAFEQQVDELRERSADAA
jgi:hypothetical protein